MRTVAAMLAGLAGTVLAADAPAPPAAAPAPSLRPRCPPIAFVSRPPRCRLGTNAIMFSITRGAGSTLWVFDPSQPDAAPRAVFSTGTGLIYDISPSWDGRRLLLTYRECETDPFHVWEIGVDGTGLRQLTRGPWHDFNPVYYPDGRIVFCSSRSESFSLCQNFLASALHICAADGSGIRRIDFTTLCSMAPAILPDGRIVFTRWEYQDKNIFSWQGLWTLHPDGRQLELYFGNTLTVPNSLFGPRPLPGTSLVAITMAAHHHEPVGDIAIVDRSLGLENTNGCRQITFATNYRVTQGRTWRDTNWGPGDRFHPWTFTDPWPVDAHTLLVSYGGFRADRDDPDAFARTGPQYGIHLLATDDGRLEPLVCDTNRSYFSAVTLAPRTPPPVLAEGAVDAKPAATFFVADVYRGLREQGVAPGQVTELRIWEQVPKKYNTEGPRFHDHYPIVGYGSYYVKKLHGSVPVAADGTAYFEAPAGAELYFQAIDTEGREISRMGSVTQAGPGQRISCAGCHENRFGAPLPSAVHAARLARPPDRIRPPEWGAGPMDYVGVVQPVLDRHCARCHSGPDPKGGVDLSGDKTRFFNMSYETLCLDKYVDYYFINPGPTGVFPALGSGSWTSSLRTMIETNHAGVVVPVADRRRIYAWIDSNVAYYPTWEMTRPYTQGGRDPCFRVKDDDGVYPKEAGRSRALEPLPWFATVTNIAHRRGLGVIESRDLNLTHPEWSPLLLDGLATAAGGRARPRRMVFASTEDPDYRALLEALREGARCLAEQPRMDMPGAVPRPQTRDFGRVF